MVRTTSKLFPAYYHIGVPHAGTASLQQALGRDERVALFPQNWFNSDRYYDSPPPLPSRPINGSVTLLSDETLVCQTHCKFMITMERIARAVPEARIIVTLREQRDLLVSACKYALAGGNFASSFEQWSHTPEGTDILSIARYSTLYRVLNLFFPRKQIHLLFFEDLACDSGRFFNEVHAILGLALDDRAFAVANVCQPEEAKAEQPKSALKNAARRFSAPSSRKRHTQAASIKWEQHDFFRGLEEEFRWSNRELQSLTGANLAQRGYLI